MARLSGDTRSGGLLDPPALAGSSAAGSRVAGSPTAGAALRRTSRRRRLVDRGATTLCIVAGAIAVAPLGAVVYFLLVDGLAAWSPAFLTGLPGPVARAGGGAVHAIIGTFLMTGLALVIATPVGLAVALYTTEYREGRLAVAVRTAVDLLAGVPSIVVGIFVYSLLVVNMRRFSGLAGAVSLAIIMLPIIARTSEEMLRIVPRRLREASLALAIPRWRAITSIFIPTVASGMVTGVVLAMSRAIGETAPLLFTALGSNFVQTDFGLPMNALPLYIFQNAINIGFPAAKARAWAAALTLVVIVLVFNLLGRWLAGRTAAARAR